MDDLARSLPNHAYNSLKTGTKQVIKAIGNQESAAHETRVSGVMLSQYGDKNHGRKYMPIDVLLDCEALAGGVPLVTKFMADYHGFNLVVKPNVVPQDITLAGIGRVVKEFSEFMSATSKAIDNGGRISADEIVDYDIEKQTQDVVDELMGILAGLKQIREAGE